ncbi:TlpA family protein disulfide reductase [Tautonia plasticadhaerens]|uniref:Thiol-disulfide oxidoreductase ResA n=1 Tax=Tautonia plasticadhaerens TaxID=2527974 RepID=A0A518HCW9_9BACT|nr:TlpA disulfide reductase family protein [Tautonia plasticadhaerens]QDV38705.1 Thiol-disulfide oxidoreductase ResA [Tautonia plasticadhaerens]
MTLIRIVAALALFVACGIASARQIEVSEDEKTFLIPYARLSQDVRTLLEEGKVEEAHLRVEEELREIEAAREADPDDRLPAIRLAWTLPEQMELTLKTRGLQDASEACETILTRQQELVDAFPGELYVINRLLVGYDIAIRHHLEDDPDRAERFFPAYRAALDSTPTDDPEWKEMVEHSARSYESWRNKLARVRHHRSLIGQPAPALPLAGDWVNGNPLTEADLDGKVILLDFWAVYCVPCIEAFPKLTRWQEQYADRGLVVVGVTGCFDYKWDDAFEQAVQVEGLSREDDLRTLEQFASHHRLNYRILAEGEDYPLHQQYKIGSIPSTVLIDREGKIRLIEVGSGEDSLRTIEAKIIELIGVPRS